MAKEIKKGIKLPPLWKGTPKKIDSTVAIPKESWDTPDGRPMIHINSNQITELSQMEVGKEYQLQITAKLLKNELTESNMGNSYSGKLAVVSYKIAGLTEE